MSDLDRLDDETNDEVEELSPAPEGATDATPATGTGQTAARKKRRRGSRGGRNRKKKPAGANASGNAQAQASAGDAPEAVADDWTDESADRGLTDDDIAEQAKEDAGIA